MPVSFEVVETAGAREGALMAPSLGYRVVSAGRERDRNKSGAAELEGSGPTNQLLGPGIKTSITWKNKAEFLVPLLVSQLPSSSVLQCSETLGLPGLLLITRGL